MKERVYRSHYGDNIRETPMDIPPIPSPLPRILSLTPRQFENFITKAKKRLAKTDPPKP